MSTSKAACVSTFLRTTLTYPGTIRLPSVTSKPLRQSSSTMTTLPSINHVCSRIMLESKRHSIFGRMRLISERLLAKRSFGQSDRQLTGLRISQMEPREFTSRTVSSLTLSKLRTELTITITLSLSLLASLTRTSSYHQS